MKVNKDFLLSLYIALPVAAILLGVRESFQYGVLSCETTYNQTHFCPGYGLGCAPKSCGSWDCFNTCVPESQRYAVAINTNYKPSPLFKDLSINWDPNDNSQEKIFEQPYGEAIRLDALKPGLPIGRGFGRSNKKVFTIFSELPDPAPGKFYEGWLMREQPLKYFSLGRMKKSVKDYYASFESETAYEDYKVLLVSEEREQSSTTDRPEILLLKGSFK